MASKNIWTPPLSALNMAYGVSPLTFGVSDKASFIPKLEVGSKATVVRDLDVGLHIDGRMRLITVEGYTPIGFGDLATVDSKIPLNREPDMPLQSADNGIALTIPPPRSALVEATIQPWGALLTSGGAATATIQLGASTSIGSVFLATPMADINEGSAVTYPINTGWSGATPSSQTGIGSVPAGEAPLVTVLTETAAITGGGLKFTLTYELLPDVPT